MTAINFINTGGYTARNTAALIRGGRSYFEKLLELIDNATTCIHFQVYIFEDDETGRQVAQALIKAAQKGVNVYLLLDAYASQSARGTLADGLQKAGVELRWFEPLFKSRNFYFGRRLHHKIFVADGIEALVGGINIGDRYNDFPDQPAWLDWAVNTKGQAAIQLNELCVKLWNRSSTAGDVKLKPFINPAIAQLNSTCYIRMRRNDWVNRKVEISRSYLEMLSRAKKEIIILSGYFLPGHSIRNALIRAVKRGVAVKIVIAGESDVKIAKAAERYWYPFLLRNHIRIFEYQAGILHGKLSVYDEKWVTAGSYNVNHISAYASLELNLDLLDENFGKQTTHELNHILETECTEIKPGHFTQQQNLFKKFSYWMSYRIYRLIFLLFTFYFRQRKKE